MPNSKPTGWLKLLSLLAVLAVGGFWPSAAHAQSAFDGKYRCQQIEIGNQIGKCQSPPLVLSQDGSYQIWGERGTYQVVQDKLVLSHSKRRGVGHFVGNDEIVFEYKIGKQQCRVTFRQIYEPPPGFDVG